MSSPPISPRVAVVVPTRDRPHALHTLLAHLANQTLPPTTIIVVDASSNPVDPVMEFGAALPLRTVQSPPGLAGSQRNTGIELALQDDGVEFIALLDDDVEPDRDYLHRLVEDLVRHPDAAGISGRAVAVKADRPDPQPDCGPWLLTLMRTFRLRGSRSAEVLSSGVNVGVLDDGIGGLLEAEWLIGCSVWRRAVAETTRFDTDEYASFLGDDVVYSIRARAFGRLLVDPSVILPHRMSDIGRQRPPEHWAEWIRGRRRIIAIAPNGSRPAFWVATVTGVAPVALGAIRGDEEHRESLRHIGMAMIDVVRGRY